MLTRGVLDQIKQGMKDNTNGLYTLWMAAVGGKVLKGKRTQLCYHKVPVTIGVVQLKQKLIKLTAYATVICYRLS